GPWNTLRPNEPHRPVRVSTGLVPQAVAQKYTDEPTRLKNGLVAAVEDPPPVSDKLRLGTPFAALVLRGSKNCTVPPRKSGRSLPAPLSERSVGSVMLNGIPVSRTVTPLICQPPKALPAKPCW